MNEKFNKSAKVEKFTNILGIAVRLIVIDPLRWETEVIGLDVNACPTTFIFKSRK